jgi:hypothetical protein
MMTTLETPVLKLSDRAIEVTSAAVADTVAAMKNGVQVVVQGALARGGWVGSAVSTFDTSDFDRRLQMLENARADEPANVAGWYGAE